MSYRCENCGKIKHEGDNVYYINKPYFKYQIPCCSIECAKRIREIELNKLKNEIEKYINSPKEKDIW